MKFLFACGGTGGHIYPAAAVANELRSRFPGCGILFIGAEGKMEGELVPREGFPISLIKITNLSRSFTPAGIVHNLASAKNLVGAMRKARKIITEFGPDAVIGTGGYVCYPVIRQAARLGIPTAIHESNAQPGLTTRMLERCSGTIMVGFEESRAGYRDPNKVVVTGTPVRREFFGIRKSEARASLGLDGRPLIVSVWGSLGATHMNEMAADFIKLNCETGAFNHIHATGGGEEGLHRMRRLLGERGVANEREKGTELRSFIYDMPRVMAAADLVLCRAGASTLGELAALGKPSVLIPSPFVTNDHQTKNARVLAEREGAVLIPQSACSGQLLFDTASELLSDRLRLEAMSQAVKTCLIGDATERIADIITGSLHKA